MADKLMFVHFKTIKKDPLTFILWCSTSIVLSLASFWIPGLIGQCIGKDLLTPLLQNNPFLVYSVTFLSNAILTSISIVGSNTNKRATTFRAIIIIFVFMFVLLLSALIPIRYLGNYSISSKNQVILLIITIGIGIYVYGFRDSEWENSVDDVRKKEDKSVAAITQQATSINDDGTGVAV